MKTSQLIFVGSVINQLKTVPQHQLTQEYVATLFADRLERRYPANFNRTTFLSTAGVSQRMAEDAETRIPSEGDTPLETREVISQVEKAVGPGGAWADVKGVTGQEKGRAVTTKSGYPRPFAPRSSC